MMEREAAFRHKCNVADGTNVAQLCVYGAYKGSLDWKVIETFDPRACKGFFYLSGNSPVMFAQEKKPSESSPVDIQKVSHEKGYMQIHQRLQPLLETITYTVQFLENIGEFVENPTPEALGLAKQAALKHEEIKALNEKKEQIIIDLHKHILQLQATQEMTAIGQSTQKCMVGILGELIRCLKGDDFLFNEMNNTKNNPNIGELINSILRELSERNLNELLNSKYFNLGCSEPLLLFDLLSDDLDRTQLINTIKKALFNDQLDTLYIQLHSTKTPCKSCLIGCCGHLLHGVIKTFFQDVGKTLSKTLKRDDVNFRFLISYHAPYEDDYPFYVPVAPDLLYPFPSILLVNMQFYDEQYKKMKERIIKEERVRIERLLLQRAPEKQGVFTLEDLKNMGLIK